MLEPWARAIDELRGVWAWTLDGLDDCARDASLAIAVAVDCAAAGALDWTSLPSVLGRADAVARVNWASGFAWLLLLASLFVVATVTGVLAAEGLAVLVGAERLTTAEA